MHVKPTQQDVLTEREMRTAEDERQRVLAVVRGRCPKSAGELDQMLAEGTGFLGSIRRIFT